MLDPRSTSLLRHTITGLNLFTEWRISTKKFPPREIQEKCEHMKSDIIFVNVFAENHEFMHPVKPIKHMNPYCHFKGNHRRCKGEDLKDNQVLNETSRELIPSDDCILLL